MAEITVQLPEPIMVRLRQQALKADVSLSELLSKRLIEDFNLAVCTETVARRRALKVLREHAGYVLRTGLPTFDATSFQWCVPVIPNLKHGKPEPIGEVRLNAETGEVLTEPSTILEMSNRVATLLGIEHFDEGFQKRLDELLTKNNNGELSQDERRELMEMVQKVNAKDIQNAQRLIERIRLPKSNRKKAKVALKQASVALDNPRQNDGL